MNKVMMHTKGQSWVVINHDKTVKKQFCIPQLNIQHVKTKIKYMSLQLKPIIEI